ncbi:MAG TPA: DUF5684 domain-containing protein [Candidatus Saccharimonadales bacterium]|nr:DUF5684 domain-containing protein [Candidatus Saccharimonadales bacterium]
MLDQLTRFAQDYDYSTYSVPTTDGGSGMAIFSGFWVIIWAALSILLLVSMWKLFVKAGQPGWASLVPFYNAYIELKIIGRPWWWLLLFFIPLVNVVVAVIVTNDIAKAFGKDVAFTLLLIFLPFIGYPMLAFGDAKYTRPAAATKA